LRDYLVAGVEDPRINAQSVLSRHFLVDAIAAGRFGPLMEQEHRFAAVMNWLTALKRRPGDAEGLETVLYALRRGADNAEGIEIPLFVAETFAGLPAVKGDLTVPNYIEAFLSGTTVVAGQASLHEPSLDTFRDLWSEALGTELRRRIVGGRRGPRVSVSEAACGSANDYRFLDAYGIAALIDYTGFDLCEKNIANARALFPGVRFEVGNVFGIVASDNAFDFSFVHDLFEHLSLEGMQTAVKELCRVTRRGLCVGFFNMDEIRDHQVKPVEEYHWNTLSMARMRGLFAECGFTAQVIHVGSFLRHRVGCEKTHNPNAYTFLLRRDR
jgi:SAM-dependent methyltransferase